MKTQIRTIKCLWTTPKTGPDFLQSIQQMKIFQKGCQAIARTLKSIKKLRDGSFLVECKEGPDPKPAPDKPLCQQPSQGFSSQDPEVLSGSNQVSGPR